jgi:hypothetical protein
VEHDFDGTTLRHLLAGPVRSHGSVFPPIVHDRLTRSRGLSPRTIFSSRETHLSTTLHGLFGCGSCLRGSQTLHIGRAVHLRSKSARISLPYACAPSAVIHVYLGTLLWVLEVEIQFCLS